MDPVALRKAFELYPEVRLIIVAHLYGTPGKMEEIKKIADEHHALIVEDAAESLGAKYKLNGEWVETGTLGDYWNYLGLPMKEGGALDEDMRLRTVFSFPDASDSCLPPYGTATLRCTFVLFCHYTGKGKRKQYVL